ncbi:hypothetical protein CDB3_11480 [Bacillus sp. CDB3]|nr:hypothetical protein CDB3_11480 [Bacillus sp. CDB3]
MPFLYNFQKIFLTHYLFHYKIIKGYTLAVAYMLKYGLTQSKYRQVDKVFETDKIVEDMKHLRYSDEEIERQLRGALAKGKSEAEEKQGSKSDIKSESKEKKTRLKMYVTDFQYPDYLYDITEL